jgi:LPS sulfotransferase NodH
MTNLHPPKDWIVPPLTIVIAALPRSGSNLLGDLMGGTELLGRPMEVFGTGSIEPGFPNRDMSIPDRLALVRERGSTSNGVAGIKLFPEHLKALDGQIRLSEWLGTPRWIWLRREDLVGQAVSYVVALQSRSFMWNRAPQAEPVYSGDEIVKQLQRFAQRDGEWHAFFARTAIRPLQVTYEELERDPVGVLQAVGRHVGIDVPAESVQPPRFQRQRTALNEAWRERFIAEYGDPDRMQWPRPSASPPAVRPARWHRLKQRVARVLGRLQGKP